MTAPTAPVPSRASGPPDPEAGPARSRRPDLSEPPRGPVPPPAREASVHRLYARVAWTTLDELPLVGPRDALVVESQIIALCRRLDVEPLEVRARPNRVDLLLRFKPVHLLADVAAAVKAGSGAHLERRGSPVRWARGLALATVGPEEVRSLMRKMTRLTRAV